MDIRNIRTFVRVAELKNFTKAAEEMNYVQSTVTMQIQLLEKELGFPLFDRIGKKISLTDMGREFLNYAYEMLHIIEKAESISNENADIKGSLRIGISESLLFSVFNDILPKLKKEYKNLNLSVKTGHTFELVDQLKQNQLDMLYISKSLNTDPDIKCYYQKQENLVFVCENSHEIAKRKKISLQELLSYEFLVTEKEGICFSLLREIAAKNNLNLRSAIEIDSVAALIELVKKGLGVAFLPEYSVKKLTEKGELTIIDVDYPVQTYFSQILCHKNRWLSPFAKGFIRLIEEERP